MADQHQAALIFDEIQCGLGRTGQLFAFQHFGVVPDVVCIAKPIAAGLPLGAFLASERFAQHITPGKHGTTFGGGPLTCRVALEYLAILEDENLLEQVRRVGAYFSQKLRELVDKFDIAVEVRGVGAIQALQLTVPGRPILEGALAKGLLINVTQDTVLRFLPPFLLQEKHVDSGMRILRKLLAEAQKQEKAANKSSKLALMRSRRKGCSSWRNKLPQLQRGWDIERYVPRVGTDTPAGRHGRERAQAVLIAASG